MPLTGIYGDTGTGKTTLAVYLLAKDFMEYEKYGNFPCKLPKWHETDIIGLTELPETDKIRIVIFDEGYTTYDNRTSMDNEQIFNTYLLMQHRKANMSIIGISQLNILDIRWREMEKYRILCRDRPIYNKDGSDYKGDFHYLIMHGNKAKWFTLSYKTALKIFPLFKTKRKILPRNYQQMKDEIKLKNPKERNKIIDGIVKEIEKNMNVPTEKKLITHDWVNNALMDLEKDLCFEKFVYIRLRNRFL